MSDNNAGAGDRPLPEPTAAVSDPAIAAYGNSEHAPIDERKNRVLEQQQYVTGRIGETCRYICYALLAAFYALEDSDKPFSMTVLAHSSLLVEIMAILATLAIISDYLQYFAGDLQVRAAIQTNNYRYNMKWLSYRARNFFYYAKQILTFVSASLLVVAVTRQLAF